MEVKGGGPGTSVQKPGGFGPDRRRRIASPGSRSAPVRSGTRRPYLVGRQPDCRFCSRSPPHGRTSARWNLSHTGSFSAPYFAGRYRHADLCLPSARWTGHPSTQRNRGSERRPGSSLAGGTSADAQLGLQTYRGRARRRRTGSTSPGQRSSPLSPAGVDRYRLVGSCCESREAPTDCTTAKNDGQWLRSISKFTGLATSSQPSLKAAIDFESHRNHGNFTD